MWHAGTRQKAPELGPPEGLDFINNTEENNYETEEGNNDQEEPAESGEGQEATEGKVAEEDDNIQESTLEDVVKDMAINDEEPEPEIEDTRTPQEIMDELLENAFLQAWKTSAKKAELPILTSNFFRTHMVPQCPKDKTLDVKKSSYKKLSKFLGKMVKEKIIEVKELQKGVESIVKVNADHPKIEAYRVVKVKQDDDNDAVEEVLPCDKAYEPPEILELFAINAAVLNFFKLFECKKGDTLSGTQVREFLKRYVQENQLQIPTNKASVKLDPVLAGIVLNKNENDVEQMTIQELVSRIQSKMSDAYSMTFPGFRSVVQKGKLDPIEISTATRSGNKKVTLVHNLEVYRINPSEFARKCQVSVAASTSVQEAVNKRPGAVEVLIQGNQNKFVPKLLIEEYKIPRKYVKVCEEVKKKKKQEDTKRRLNRASE